MLGFKFDRRGAFLFLSYMVTSLIIDGIYYLITGGIVGSISGIVFQIIFIYLFFMFYHKKKKIIFSHEEMKNISYSYQFFMVGIILLLMFANPFLITYLYLIISILSIIFYYFLIYFILWMYKKINHLK